MLVESIIRGEPSLLLCFSYLIMVSISITPSLLFFIAKKSNQKTLVKLNASGYLNASALSKWMFLFVNAFQYSDLANQPVKKGFIIASAFVVNLRCSYVFLFDNDEHFNKTFVTFFHCQKK